VIGVLLPWPFDRGYLQLALIAGIVVGAVAPLVGGFLVQRRMSLLGDGIGHVAFAGVAAGLLTGVWPVWTALVAAVLAALGIEWLRARGGTSGDLALAVFFYGGIAAGAVLASRAAAVGRPANVLPYLFGSILTVTVGDVITVGVIGLLIVTVILLVGRALLAIAVDEETARVAGLPVDALNALLAVLTAVTVVAAMRVVGLLLVAAMLVLPIATARPMVRSLRATLALASGVGVGSVVLGLAAARVWGLAPGGAIVLVTVAAFAVVTTARRTHLPLGSHDH
jgi:zinc transport system permease protein